MFITNATTNKKGSKNPQISKPPQFSEAFEEKPPKLLIATNGTRILRQSRLVSEGRKEAKRRSPDQILKKILCFSDILEENARQLINRGL